MRKTWIALILFVAILSGTGRGTENGAGSKALDEKLLAGLKFRAIGPAFMSGRIADIAIDPTDRKVWYIAVGSGGVWKTVNAGTTWTPIFYNEAVSSIGDNALERGNPEVLYVGTGEADMRSDIAQPTIRRLYTSRMASRYSQPSRVGM